MFLFLRSFLFIYLIDYTWTCWTIQWTNQSFSCFLPLSSVVFFRFCHCRWSHFILFQWFTSIHWKWSLWILRLIWTFYRRAIDVLSIRLFRKMSIGNWIEWLFYFCLGFHYRVCLMRISIPSFDCSWRKEYRERHSFQLSVYDGCKISEWNKVGSIWYRCRYNHKIYRNVFWYYDLTYFICHSITFQCVLMKISTGKFYPAI